ncbi:MAG: methyltransferase domain-containing protein [Ardenticatenales bacterium]|nr:methyltransferase domain-containing protein [Ardenticatenales bacterium]
MPLMLLCPICAAPLLREPRILRCPNRHTFDVAREGYVNLLLEQKAGRVLGDSKEMLRDRRAFLEGDFYKPLSDAVTRLAESHLSVGAECVILDVGCGEGYYLGQLQHQLDRECHYVGMDISKEAARLAARKYPDILFLVADTWQSLLLGDQSVHLLINIFAPRNAAEFARVSAREGLLLVVIPCPEHLGELREEGGLIEIEENKEQRVVEQMAESFDLVARKVLRYPMHLSQDALGDLIGMTPSARHTSEEARRGLEARVEQQVTAAFTLLLFRRTGLSQSL